MSNAKEISDEVFISSYGKRCCLGYSHFLIRPDGSFFYDLWCQNDRKAGNFLEIDPENFNGLILENMKTCPKSSCGCNYNTFYYQEYLIACQRLGYPQEEIFSHNNLRAPDFSALVPTALVGKTIGAGGKAFIDGLNKQKLNSIITVRADEGFDINGWAFDDRTKSAPEMIFIELSAVKSGEKYYSAATRGERKDVAQYFKIPALKNAAYILNADIKSIPSGEYHINIIQVSDGRPICAYTGKKISKTD